MAAGWGMMWGVPGTGADGAPQQSEDKLKAMAGKRCLEIIA